MACSAAVNVSERHFDALLSAVIAVEDLVRPLDDPRRHESVRSASVPTAQFIASQAFS